MIEGKELIKAWAKKQEAYKKDQDQLLKLWSRMDSKEVMVCNPFYNAVDETIIGNENGKINN